MDAETEQAIAVAQLVVEQLGGANGAMTLYLTVTSGYLLVAYLAGKELTRLQVAIITRLYVVFATTNTMAMVISATNLTSALSFLCRAIVPRA